MKPVDLEPFQLMQIMAVFFETHAIPYRVVGSLASMAFGEPRFTNDIDIAAELTEHHLADLFRSFPAPEYYLSEPAARDAIRRKAQRAASVRHWPSGSERSSTGVVMAAQGRFGSSR